MTSSLGTLIGSLILKPAILLGGAALLAVCLRRHTAAARHAVWTIAIVATLGLPILGSVVPPLGVALLDRWLPSTASTSVTTGASSARAQSSNQVVADDNNFIAGLSLRTIERDSWLPRSLLAIWLLGALLISARRVASHRHAHRIVQRARTISPTLERRFADVMRSAVVHRPVRLLVTHEATTPAVAGVLRPVVLLPAAAERWPATDIGTVLIHELGHIRRHDCLINLIGDVATAVYWCNPAVWFAVARLRAESERACDDRVLHTGAEPDAYADLLLGIARTVGTGSALPRAATAMARAEQLESRLLAVLDSRIRRDPLSAHTWVALSAAGIVFATPLAAVTRTDDTPGTPPLAVAQVWGPEPDRLADELARPQSERVPLSPEAFRLSPQARQALAGPDSLLARQLVAALDHRPQHEADLIRERAAWALSQSRDGRLVEPLRDALTASDWRVQAYAAWTLALTGDTRAVEPLLPLLEHRVWRLRAMAAAALRQLNDPRAEPAMSTALTDPAWQVRREAVLYLGALGGPALNDQLRPRLDDRHVAVRIAARNALSPH